MSYKHCCNKIAISGILSDQRHLVDYAVSKSRDQEPMLDRSLLITWIRCI